MNEIQPVRDRIAECFDEKLILPNAHQTLHSPSGRYQIAKKNYKQNAPDLNWHICEIVVIETSSNEEILRVKCEEGRFFHDWIESETADYLLFSEALGGQSVFDLCNRKLASYYNADEPFIWVQFYPSPDLRKLAVHGCYWACPFEIVTYDFSTPLQLPLPELNREGEWPKEVFDGWINDAQFQLRNGDATRIITIE